MFNAAGLEEVHQTIAQFYTHACRAENAAEFRSCMQCRSEWINRHNAQSSDIDARALIRVNGSKEFKERYTTLTTTKSDKITFEGPAYDFVMTEAFDPKLDGEWDPTIETKQMIMGKLRDGVWVLRGREGVFKSKQKESAGTKQQTLEDDGAGPFAQQRLENKMAVIDSAKNRFEKERAQKYVAKPLASDAMSMLELLSQQALNVVNDRPSGGPQADDANTAEACRAQGSDDESGNDEDAAPRGPSTPSRLASLFSSGVGALASKPAKGATPKPSSHQQLRLHRRANRQQAMAGPQAM